MLKLGKYMYADASSPRVNGDKGRIVSTMLANGSASCLHFFYNMYGSSIGTLKVWIRQNVDSRQIALWALTGHQQQGWQEAKVPIPAQKDSFSVSSLSSGIQHVTNVQKLTVIEQYYCAISLWMLYSLKHHYSLWSMNHCRLFVMLFLSDPSTPPPETYIFPKPFWNLMLFFHHSYHLPIFTTDNTVYTFYFSYIFQLLVLYL